MGWLLYENEQSRAQNIKRQEKRQVSEGKENWKRARNLTQNTKKWRIGVKKLLHVKLKIRLHGNLQS